MAPIRAERPRFDVDLIVARLRDTAETWVPRLFPNGRRLADEWRLANIHGDAPRNSGSCVITLGARAGDWIDFDGNHGGGPISAIEQATGLTGYELIAEAAEDRRRGAGRSTGRSRHSSRRHAATRRRRSATSWRTRAGPRGTPAERYLAARGLVVPDGADLLFHPDLTHWESKSGYPALIGVVRDRDGEIIGLHRTYLEEASGAVTKAAVAKPRMMLGRVAGGAVRLGAVVEGAPLGICEGIETGLAVMTARPGLPVWATLSTSGLEQVALPASVNRIVILADHDASGAGLRAAETAARRLRSEGREVVIAMPPREGDDFNDLLLREGAEAVAPGIAAAETTGGRGPGADRPASTAQLRHRRHGPADHARRRGRSRARGRESLEPAARLEPHALALPLRRHPDLGRARRRGPPGRRHPDRGAPAPHAGPPRRLAAHERQGRARPRAAAHRRGEVGARHPRSRRCRCSSASSTRRCSAGTARC